MNAAPDDASAFPARADNEFDGPLGGGWYVYLSPALQMGLQVDPDGLGSVSMQIDNTLFEVEGAVAYATLAVVDANGATRTLAAGTTEVGTLATGEHTLSVDLRPEGVTRIDPLPRQNLVLHLDVGYDTDIGTTGFLGTDIVLVGGEARLPLLEYHDALDGLPQPPSGLQAAARVAVVEAAPGSRLLAPIDVQWDGDAADFTLAVQGTNADWAQPTDATLRVGPGASVVHVPIVVPADAEEGEQAELVVVLAKSDDPGQSALAHLTVRASAAAPRFNDDMETEAEDAPMGILPVAGGLAAFAAFGRVRRPGGARIDGPVRRP